MGKYVNQLIRPPLKPFSLAEYKTITQLGKNKVPMWSQMDWFSLKSSPWPLALVPVFIWVQDGFFTVHDDTRWNGVRSSLHQCACENCRNAWHDHAVQTPAPRDSPACNRASSRLRPRLWGDPGSEFLFGKSQSWQKNLQCVLANF